MVRTHLTTEHILASSALPVFFRPVEINQAYYGDGGIRFSTPLSPAIHLGRRATGWVIYKLDIPRQVVLHRLNKHA